MTDDARTSSQYVTRLLTAVSEGRQAASGELLPLVYGELRRLAESWLSRLPHGQTLQPTALVHEAYLRLVGDESITWENRGHFFAAAAQAMRNILVDQARRKSRIKHGVDWKRVAFQKIDDEVLIEADNIDLIALDAALSRLAAEDERRAEIVNLRFFAGLSIDDTARALGISIATVKRDWLYAKAWLYDALGGSRGIDDGHPTR